MPGIIAWLLVWAVFSVCVCQNPAQDYRCGRRNMALVL